MEKDKDEIEVTPEMIEAGEMALLRYDPEYELPADAARRIFCDMWRRKPSA